MKISLISYVLILSLPLTLHASNKPSVELRREAQNKLREFVPKLSLIEEKYTDDPQMILGLAMIYSSYSPTPEFSEKAVQLYRKAVKLSPDNKCANIGLINRMIEDYNRHYDIATESLKGLQEYAIRSNLKEIEVPSWADYLYDMLKEKDQEKVVINDFNNARATLEMKFDPERKVILSEIDKAENSEPENAIYSSIRAQLFFDLGKDNEAIEELERSSKKPYLNNYWKDSFNAQMRVLKEADFAENYRNIIEDELSSLYRGLPGGKKPFEIAKQYEDKGNIQKAKEIYEIVIRIANQIREESVPIDNGKRTAKRGENDYSKYLEKQVKDKLAQLKEEKRD
jgi:hypothetical protein